MVSELMILANGLAAKELAANNIPAIYRSQGKPQLAPMPPRSASVKTAMSMWSGRPTPMISTSIIYNVVT